MSVNIRNFYKERWVFKTNQSVSTIDIKVIEAAKPGLTSQLGLENYRGKIVAGAVTKANKSKSYLNSENNS